MRPLIRSTCPMTDLRLIIWDVDGTLVNSRAGILHAMRGAFDAVAVPYPGDDAALSGVGLSIERLFGRLLPDADKATLQALIDAYKSSYYDHRAKVGSKGMAPYFDGAEEALHHFRKQDWTLMAVATGKSRRGLDAMIEGHNLQGFFQSTQSADEHPSKPHPSMVLTALAETGVAAENALMVGDTTFDLEMGRSGGVKTLGVGWGYHPQDDLVADRVIDRMDQLIPAIEELIG